MTSEQDTDHSAQSKRLVRLDVLKPGIPVRVNHAGRAVLLCRLDDRSKKGYTVHAVQDTCPHEDISLSLGVVCEHRLRCPLHGSEFDLRTGRVLSDPAEDDLAVFAIQVVDGWICI